MAAMFREEDDDLKQTLKGVVQRAIAMVEKNPSTEIEGQDLLDLEALLGSVDLSQVDVTSSLTARYTQTDGVAPRVRELATRITREVATPYDAAAWRGGWVAHAVTSMQKSICRTSSRT